MTDSARFRALSPRHKALVTIAVLLDGREANVYLENDALHGQSLSKAATELATQGPELRMPYLGSALRAALAQIK